VATSLPLSLPIPEKLLTPSFFGQGSETPKLADERPRRHAGEADTRGRCRSTPRGEEESAADRGRAPVAEVDES